MNTNNTIELINLALDAALMRQTAIANNIANANTENYKTITVNFEQQLDAYAADAVSTRQSGFAFLKPVYEENDTPVSIDEQIALGVKNATQYRALVKGLNYKLAIMKLAAHGNNQS